MRKKKNSTRGEPHCLTRGRGGNKLRGVFEISEKSEPLNDEWKSEEIRLRRVGWYWGIAR